MSSRRPDTDFCEGRRLPLVEDFYTIQGEGFHSGKPAYFIRLGGCDVGCSWCDAKYTWNPLSHPLVDTDEIVERAASFEAQAIFLETSGSHPLSGSFDWICLSPKRKQPPLAEAFAAANELKVIIETEEDLLWAEECAAKVGESCMLFMQPEWSRSEQMTPTIVEYVKAHPKWNISIQIHKFMHIP